jgi:hypothetical protein
MDGLACIDDQESVKICQVLTDPVGSETLIRRYGITEQAAVALASAFGISGGCNLIGAIKTARHFGLGRGDLIITVATDNIARYHTTMRDLDGEYGRLDECESVVRVEGILRHQKTDWFKDGTQENRRQWHNLKYYTWVEQQDKGVDELNAQLDPEWWLAQQARIPEIDKRILDRRAYT